MELTERQQKIKDWADEQGMSTFEDEEKGLKVLTVKVNTYRYLRVDERGMINAEATKVLDSGGGEISIGDKEIRIYHENGKSEFHVSRNKFPNFR